MTNADNNTNQISIISYGHPSGWKARHAQGIVEQVIQEFGLKKGPISSTNRFGKYLHIS